MSSQDQTKRLRLLRVGVHAAAAAALLLGAAIYYAFAARPLMIGRQQRLADTQRLEAMQQAVASARGTQIELRTTLANIQRREAELVRRIPLLADEHELLHALTQAAQEAGLHVVDYRREGVADEATHSTLRIGVKCRGSYVALCAVLDRLQNLQRLVIIENLNVTSDMASDDQAIVMTIVLFYGLKTSTPPQEDVNDA